MFAIPPRVDVDGVGPTEVGRTFALGANDVLLAELNKAAGGELPGRMQMQVVAFTVNNLEPTHVLDAAATAERQNLAAQRVPTGKGLVHFKANQPLKPKQGPITEKEWQVLRTEHEAFLDALPRMTWVLSKVGIVGLAVIVTVVLAAYVYAVPAAGRAEPRPRGWRSRGCCSRCCCWRSWRASGHGPLYLFGIGADILVAMILAIAYDRRFAMGVASLHAMLVTVGAGPGDRVLPDPVGRRADQLLPAGRRPDAAAS